MYNTCLLHKHIVHVASQLLYQFINQHGTLAEQLVCMSRHRNHLYFTTQHQHPSDDVRTADWVQDTAICLCQVPFGLIQHRHVYTALRQIDTVHRYSGKLHCYSSIHELYGVGRVNLQIKSKKSCAHRYCRCTLVYADICKCTHRHTHRQADRHMPTNTYSSNLSQIQSLAASFANVYIYRLVQQHLEYGLGRVSIIC